MNPGRMDRIITLERKTTTTSAIGEPVPTWSTLVQMYAAYKPSPGGEAVNGEKVEADMPVVFTIRYYQGLTSRDRLTYSGQVYNILSVTEVGRFHLMEIKARRQE